MGNNNPGSKWLRGIGPPDPRRDELPKERQSCDERKRAKSSVLKGHPRPT
jgi:hypothetical protein